MLNNEEIYNDIRDLDINGSSDSTSDLNNIIDSPAGSASQKSSSGAGGTGSSGSEGDTSSADGSGSDDTANENLAYDISKTVADWATSTWNKATEIALDVYTKFMNSKLVSSVVEGFTENDIEGVNIFGNNTNGFFGAINTAAAETVGANIESVMDALGSALDGLDIGEFGETLNNIGDIVSGLLQPYGSGESPSFALAQAEAKALWEAGSPSYDVSYDTDPFEMSSGRFSIYGKLILGAPFIFGDNADPTNRSLLNTIIKDSRILSLTPGLPKYNGGQIFTTSAMAFDKLTKSYDDMMAYILLNRINKKRLSQDTRYYTFEAKYKEYYDYLETALLTVYMKLGLATRGPNKYDLLKLKNNNSSLGFFVSQVNLSESFNNSETNIGAGMASDVNGQSSRFLELNYLTGFGQTAVGLTRRILGIASESGNLIRALVGDMFKNTSAVLSNKTAYDGPMGVLIGAVAGAAIDIALYVPWNDMSLIAERFTVTNGMKVMYPELWSDSRYARSISVEYSFTSPYGDPASIFKYVYVPFFSLLTFAMPRQASHNGLISPFFVRASIPGMFNSDLALISDITWNRGGSAGMWTKDGLPRLINGSITISDLYPFLCLVGHVSTLSHNPSYTTWLDSFSGLRAIYTESETDPMNNYFKQMINNISGVDNGVLNNGLWNRFSNDEMIGNAKSAKSSESIYTNTNNKSIIWMNKI